MAVRMPRLLRKVRGVSAVEYGLIAGLIALVMAAGAVILGEGLNEIFGDAGTEINNTADPNPVPTPSPRY